MSVSASTHRQSGYLWLAPASLLGACLMFYFLMPLFSSPHIDDLHYGYPYRHWLLGEGEFPGFGPWWATIKAHFYGINGRFGDKLLVGFLLLPKWAGALLASVSTTGFMSLTAYVGCGSMWKHPRLWSAVIIALILALPWYDSMFTGCMIVNYQMAAFWGTGALAIYFRADRKPARHSALYCVGAFFVGQMAGSWHECFTFIIAPGLLLYPLFVKRLNRVQISVLAGGVAGGIFILCNPGFWNRYDNQMHLMNMKAASDIFQYANVALLLPLLYLVVVCSKKLRRRFSRREWGIMTACVIALLLNMVIYLSNLSLPRVLWFGQIVGIAGLAVIFSHMHPGRRASAVLSVLIWTATAFCMAHFAVAATEQYKVDREYRAVIDLYRNSPDGVVYYTLRASNHRPWIALDRPFYDQLEGWHVDAGTDDFYRTPHEVLHLIPEELKEFTPARAHETSPGSGLYEYRGYYVADNSRYPYRRWRKLIVDSGKERKRKYLYVLCHWFRTPDGHTWAYLQEELPYRIINPEIK